MVAAAHGIPKDHAILQCHICRGHIGIFRPDDLSLPLNSSMFKGIDDFHGYPPPFPAEVDGRGDYLTWQFFKCPYCRSIPFEEPDLVQTPYGTIKVGETNGIPRAKKLEDANQKKINEEWRKEQDAGLSLEDRNQKKIRDLFNDETVAIIPKDQAEFFEKLIPGKIKVSNFNLPSLDFKDTEHIESHIVTEEDVKDIKDVKTQTDRTEGFTADKSVLKGRCKYCAKPFKHPSSKSRHEGRCLDNPKNQKKKGKKK